MRIPALTNSNNITSLDADEARRAMGSQVTVSLLITVVLLDVVKVVTTDDNGAFHLGGNNSSSKNTTTDGNTSSERTLLIDVNSTDGFLGSLETKTNVLVPTGSSTLGNNTLVVLENSFLLLE